MLLKIASVAADLVKQRRTSYLQDVSLPLSVRSMISVHLVTPWIPDFWTIALRAAVSAKPRRSVRVEDSFDFPIGFGEDGSSWFFPARSWWIAHAQVAHPPQGLGCDLNAHAALFSGEGRELDYATIYQDGRIEIGGASHFAEECTWWDRAFGAAPVEPVKS